ncbi:MAG: cytochrome P450 [Alphaproteobacteria bacterium]|nr:cytochrome P450 [Alphaproteobacteria bacterium]
MANLQSLPEIPLGVADLQQCLRDARRVAPLARGPLGVILALRQRQLEQVVGDYTRQLETDLLQMRGITTGPIFDFYRTAMVFSNGEEHRRRRTPVARTFAIKLIETMRPRIAACAEALIAPLVGKGAVDFRQEVAAKLPTSVVADILGISTEGLPDFHGWINDASESLGFFDPARQSVIEASFSSFYQFVGGLIESRRAAPLDDFLSDYVRAATEDEAVSDLEMKTQILALILAGSDTTRNALCMSLALILAHGPQWRAFCDDPTGLKKNIVDEGLRFEPVALGIPRIVVQDLEIDGYVLKPGTFVLASLLSMMRDPDVFREPDTYDVFRTDMPRWHPAFGAGAHRCLGEALARVELEEAMACVARLAPHSALVHGLPRLSTSGVRQVDQCVLRLEA